LAKSAGEPANIPANASTRARPSPLTSGATIEFPRSDPPTFDRRILAKSAGELVNISEKLIVSFAAAAAAPLASPRSATTHATGDPNPPLALDRIFFNDAGDARNMSPNASAISAPSSRAFGNATGE
jgi:hypothetical protein|tara:strand:- start:28 stop:408 length:381 start_codon:yes stop_codon:yes gene_type:complete